VFGVTTPATAEFRLGSAVAPFDMETPAAALGSIGRVDKHHCHSQGCCLVTDKLLQLVKRPTRKHSPLLFTNRYPPAYSFQILQDYATAGAFGYGYDLLTDDVIGIFTKSLFFS
jgi:hypothetical protein